MTEYDDEFEEEFLDLADLAGQMARRGRKSEVDQTLVERLVRTPAGKAWIYPGSQMVGQAFDEYVARAGRPKHRSDGKMETTDEARKRAISSWQSKYRQRATAVATAAGVDDPLIGWLDNGSMVLGRKA